MAPRYDVPIIHGVNSIGNSVPILVDSFGRIIEAPINGAVLCKGNCAIGGKAFAGFSARVFTLFALSSFTGNPLNKLRIFTWKNEPTISTLSQMNLYKEVLIHTSFVIEFTDISRYMSIFAINPVSGFYDACCFDVNTDVITISGFS